MAAREIHSIWLRGRDAALWVATQREFSHPPTGSSVATLSAIQMVAVAVWNCGSVRAVAGTDAVSERLRQRFTQLHRIAGRIYVAGVFVAGLLGLYIQFLSGAHGTAKVVQPCRRRRCGVVDDDDGQRLRIYPGGKSAAASTMDGAQLCGRTGISGGARDQWSHWLGESGCGG